MTALLRQRIGGDATIDMKVYCIAFKSIRKTYSEYIVGSQATKRQSTSKINSTRTNNAIIGAFFWARSGAGFGRVVNMSLGEGRQVLVTNISPQLQVHTPTLSVECACDSPGLPAPFVPQDIKSYVTLHTGGPPARAFRMLR
jgi:hypothetical protein